jgi:hypothetical protein
MTTDEMQLLRDFRSDIPEPDEETIRRAYAYATSQPHAARRPWLRLPATKRARMLGIAAAAALLAAAAIGAYVLAANPGRKQIQIGEDLFVAPIPVANAAAADALLPFHVVLPSNATSTSLTVSKQAQALTGHLESSTDGSYVLSEQASNWTVAHLQKLDQFWHPYATHKVVIVDGVHVLIQAWSDGSLEAQWIRGDGADHVLSWVEGPDTTKGQTSGQTFSEQQALSIASDIISQGG